MKKIVILGAGESGTGAALLAKVKGYEVFVSDKGTIKDKYKKELTEAKIPFEQEQHTIDKILEADCIIKSPGIPNNDLVKKIKAKNIPILDELAFAAKFTSAKLILISGTNGKTTTTLLTYHLLTKAGLKVGLAGNVGHSLAQQIIKDIFDFYVVEISSFQLEYVDGLNPYISVLTNITPDHLDRYNYSFENYIKAKFNIVKNLNSQGIFIYFKEDPIINEYLNTLSQADHFKQYVVSLKENLSEGAYLKNDILKFCIKNQYLDIPVKLVPLTGKHNYINTMFAITIALYLKIDPEVITKALQRFESAPHRMEKVAILNNIQFINDSKATNLDAVKYALDGFQQPIIWIAGGVDKGNNYKEIEALATQKVKGLVALGKDNHILLESFRHAIKNIASTSTMEDAVQKAFEMAKPGDVILLSPACASFDLFKNYEDRGEKFKKSVQKLLNSQKKVINND